LDLFDTALDGANEALALDAVEAWMDAVGMTADGRPDPARMKALVERMRGSR